MKFKRNIFAFVVTALLALVVSVILPGCQGQESTQTGQDRWQHIAIVIGPTTPGTAERAMVEREGVTQDDETGQGEPGKPGDRFTYGDVSVTVAGDGQGVGSADRGDANQDNKPSTEAELELSGNAVTTGENASIANTPGSPETVTDEIPPVTQE